MARLTSNGVRWFCLSDFRQRPARFLSDIFQRWFWLGTRRDACGTPLVFLPEAVALGARMKFGQQGSGTCFAAGTKVSTPKGEVNIEDIKAGDAIYTYDFDNYDRAVDSAIEKTDLYNDPVANIEWSPANGTADSFAQKEMRAREAGAPGGNTYNKINSPGDKILRDSGCP